MHEYDNTELLDVNQTSFLIDNWIGEEDIWEMLTDGTYDMLWEDHYGDMDSTTPDESGCCMSGYYLNQEDEEREMRD